MILGILAIWIATGAIILAAVAYTRACLRLEPAVDGAVPDGANWRRGDGANGNGRSSGNGHVHGNGHGKATLKAAKANLAPSPRRANAPSHPLGVARRAFIVSALGAFIAAAVMMFLVVGRHYEVAYIWGHSDNELPIGYRIASFWAGQEGTFLLWAVYGSVIGWMLIRRARDYERWVMPFFCAIQIFLFVILCIMSPFKLHDLNEIGKNPEVLQGFPVPQTAWQKMLYFFGIGTLFTPIDGTGLNITLQNPWMVIHPPIIFIGFAALAVPACFALGALWRRDYGGWVKKAVSWTIFGWMAIGFGKFLGGYWAYETLGWGGYWAWDPVENTSIVPWIFGTALVHGMLVQQSRGSLKHANLFLAIFTFLTVLYGTFLTRSGVLGEFSVHSFTAPAFAVYVMMLAFMGIWALGGFGFFLRRFKDIQSESAYDRLNERPFGFFLAVILLIGAGTVVCVGMSWPIISPLILGKAASLKFDFYNRALLPIATFMCLLMAITPLMPWRKATEKPAKPFQKTVTIVAFLILLLGVPAAALAWHGGSQQIQLSLAQAFQIPASLLQPDTGFSPAAIPALVVFTLAAALGVFVNIVMFARTIRNGLLQTGAWLAHISICIGFIGVVISSVFSSTEVLTLAKGETARAHGYQFTYAGLQEAKPPAKNFLQFTVTRGKQSYVAQLPYFKHMMGSQEQDITRPFIYKYLGHDLYLAASGWSNGSDRPQVARGETISTMGYQIALRDFKHENLPATTGGAPTGPIIIRPVLEVRTEGQTATVMPVYKISPDGSVEREPAMMPGGTHRVLVERVIVPNEAEGVTAPAVRLSLVPLTPIDLVRVEASYKPGINLVWLAGYLLLFACFLAYRRRARIAAQSGDREEAKRIARAPEKAPVTSAAKPMAKV